MSHRKFTIHVRTLPGIKWVSAVIRINGKRVKSVGRAHITALVNLVGLPKGTFVLSITVKASNGQSVTGTRTYHTCVPKSKGHYGAAMLTGMAALVAAPPAAAARPAHFVEPFENGVTVGLALPCPQPPLRIVATVHWSNSAPKKLTANTCTGPPGEGGESEAVKRGGSNVALTTAHWGPPSEPGEPPPYPVGPRLVAEAEVNSHRHQAKWVIFFQLAEGDTYIESGTIFLYSKYVPPRRVWQSEKESFGNVCMNAHKKITSINHRRGCYLPPTVFATEKVRWSHR